MVIKFSKYQPTYRPLKEVDQAPNNYQKAKYNISTYITIILCHI